MRVEKVIINENRNVSLTAYLQDCGGEFTGFTCRPAVIILPGGSYTFCSQRESDPVALAYSRCGFQTFILRYTLSDKGDWPLPLNDYDDAFNIIKENATLWGVDIEKVAVVGFSAGGHLAASVATMAKNRPQVAILGYPVILDGACEVCKKGIPVPYRFIDRKTPPCFIFGARDDDIVHNTNFLKMAEALSDNNIFYELHIYSYGGHGFSSGDSYLSSNTSNRVPNWLNDSIGFIKEVVGEMTPNGYIPPKISHYVTADYEKTLSIDCTMELIIQHIDKIPKLADFINQLLSWRSSFSSLDVETYLKKAATLRCVLWRMKIPQEKVRDINNYLMTIPNDNFVPLS